MRFDLLTLFPQAVQPYLASSILGRAQDQDFIDVHVHDIRDFAADKHGTVDDTPYGGGPGMVMKIEPIDRALEQLQVNVPRTQQHVVVMSAKGELFNQKKAQSWADAKKSLTIISGRYEGIDQRVVEHLADEEVSIGPYVLAGGELPALVIIEAVARLIPGVLGNVESLKEESYSTDSSLLTPHFKEYPQYTKPEEYKGWKVPEVLLSGDHDKIQKWRESHSK